MKDEVLRRKYYVEDGTVTHHQIIKPKHKVQEPLFTTVQECRANYYYPGLARKIRAWVTL